MTVTKCPHCSGVVSIKFELVKTTQPETTPARPPASATSRPTPNGLVPVGGLVTCTRCGQEDLAWQKSNKTGKSYLCLGVIRDGQAYASRREFHQCSARGSWPNTRLT